MAEMAPWFFLSYARRDSIGHEHLKEFHVRLAQQVAGLAGLPSKIAEDEVGFFDKTGIEPGTHWPAVLRRAIETTQMVVCLYSPSYFKSEYCGREFQAFHLRLEALAPHAERKEECHPRILPVLWYPPGTLEFPPAVKHIQYAHDAYGPIYEAQGLYQLMKRSEYKDAFEKFLFEFARRLVNHAGAGQLDDWALPELPGIPSAFHRHVTPAAEAAHRAASSGPGVAQFVFVAGDQNELRAVRARLDAYGQEGGRDWRPYFPDPDDEVGLLAQAAASSEKLHYEFVPLDANLIRHLRESEERNKIVVLLVDSWAVRLPQYERLMAEYDSQNFLNCAVLVPWNDRDQETATQHDELIKALRLTFKRYITANHPYFRHPIGSVDALQKELAVIFSQIRARLIQQKPAARPVAGDGERKLPQLRGPGAAA